MKDSLEQYKAILDNLYDGVYLVDKERRILYWNAAAERITGFTSQQVVGTRCMDNVLNHVTANGVQLCHNGCPLLATMMDGKRREAEVYLHHQNGHRLPVLVRTSPFHNDEGEIIGGVEVFSDNTSLLSIRTHMRRLEDINQRDPLTNIGNRRFLERRLNLALADFEQNRVPFGIIFADIDNFKKFNDTYGHELGDNVLRMVANTLAGNIRIEDTAVRWGGEEFVILLNGVDAAGLCIAAEKLRSLVENSHLSISDAQLNITISGGVAMMHVDETIEALLHRADQNMYKSKKAGRNRITCDEPAPNENSK
jgi:diguanylate cyclase (GGDEF)-like protein/PAS domain S-box-containing protein